MVRSLKNDLAPINRIPPEVLTSIPDFWDKPDRDRGLIRLTHVCRTWREIFISCSPLWTNLSCIGTDKTHVYLERSKSSPIHLHLQGVYGIYHRDPLFQVIPHAVGRLESLFTGPAPGLRGITAHLSHPAPLLKRLSIGGRDQPVSPDIPVITAALFNGDLSSLHVLHLYHVRTELPWGNMANLTSFTLGHVPLGEAPIRRLLDFFESAPRLREVELLFITLTSGGQNGRLVSLGCLKSFIIRGDQPTSLLFDHLLIPAGADLRMRLESPCPRIGAHLPRFLDNLRNLPNFTRLHLDLGKCNSVVQFTGPNGGVRIDSVGSGIDATGSVLRFLASVRVDTSMTKQLEIISRGPLSEDPLIQALLPMKNLNSLTISPCTNLLSIVRVLDPDINPSNLLACPKLEELYVRTEKKEGFIGESLVGMAKARASRGAKLKSVKVVKSRKSVDSGRVARSGGFLNARWLANPRRYVDLGIFVPLDVSELSKHVSHVEYDLEVVEEVGDYSDYGDEEDWEREFRLFGNLDW